MSGHCLNCDTSLQGKFCHACGQKRLEPDDRRLPRLLAELFGEITSLDGRSWRTLLRLVFAPGRYLGDFIAGRRRRYLSPVAIFLAINVVYFFAPGVSDFTPSLSEHMNQNLHAGIATAIVDGHVASSGASLDEFREQFELRQAEQAKTLVILHIPLLAFGLWLLHCRSRQLFVADHVLVAFAIMSFWLLHVMVTANLLELLVKPRMLSPDIAIWILRLGLILPFLAWMYFLLRGAYRHSRPVALGYVPLLMLVFVAAHLGYRFLLFLASYLLA